MTWTNKPTNFAIEVVKNCEDHVKKVAAVGLQSVVVGSPVMDGHYRASHRVTVDQEDSGYDPNALDTNGASTLTKGNAEIVKFKLGSNLYIQTNAPHATRLENGWSDQAPNGVYSIAFMNMRNV